jgi:hypothetical protein
MASRRKRRGNNKNGIVKARNVLWPENGKHTQKTEAEEKFRLIVSASV